MCAPFLLYILLYNDHMKVGLLSDIHCDLYTFRLALDLLHEEGVDAIVCAGDIAEKGDGASGDAVVTLMQLLNIPCVRGNHDGDAIGNQRWLRENGDPANPNFANRLHTEATLAYFAALPLTLNFVWKGKRVLLAHGTPWSEHMYLYYNSPREVYERIRQDTDADVLIVGHTHRPMCMQFNGLTVINPGAVSSMDGSGTCGVLYLPEARLDVFNIRTGERVLDFPQLVLE
jgi:putative phosphoesterase